MNKETKIRGIAATIFTALAVITTLILFVYFLLKGESFSQSIGAAALLGFFCCGLGIGISHISAIHKKLSNLLYIPFAGWGIYLVLILAIPYFGGAVFMLSDMIKYLRARKV